MGFFKIKKIIKDNDQVDYNTTKGFITEEKLELPDKPKKTTIRKTYTVANKSEPYANKTMLIIKKGSPIDSKKFFKKEEFVVDYTLPEVKEEFVVDYTLPEVKEKFGIIDNINTITPFLFRQKKIAVFIHMFYPDLWDTLDSYLDNIECEFDLYVNVVIDNYDKDIIYKIIDKYPNAKIIKNINKGRDIGGLITMSKYIIKNQYDSVYFIHTKKSPHIKSGHVWRNDMLKVLMGDENKVNNLIKDIRYNGIGLIVPALYKTNSIGGNYDNLKRLMKLYEIDYDLERLEFSAGTFFLCGAELIEQIGMLTDFYYFEDASDLDGQMAHAFERFLPILTIKKLNKTIKYV
jgi:lipopolysaccharide biosynthesis protein